MIRDIDYRNPDTDETIEKVTADGCVPERSDHVVIHGTKYIVRGRRFEYGKGIVVVFIDVK